MKFKLTPRIQQHVIKALDHSISVIYQKEAEDVRAVDLSRTSLYPVSMDLVLHVAELTDSHFHELILGSGLYFEPKEEAPQDPEFLAYMEKLRAEQKEREYKQMVSDVLNSEDQKFNLGIKPDEIKEIKSHIATIFNILFSMIAVYTAVYKASGSLTEDFGMQILLSLGGALLIGVVEVLLYANYAYKVTTEKKKKKSHKLTTL
ncbi:endoplasmic reticulum-based factor for assembly of V-ATPase-domain-containing protein [Blakeslea trispora]|nr:endoplasmic reticulum-based factor for assembly of V-ATPase-domain-containing protein [Blakeslea trispora]